MKKIVLCTLIVSFLSGCNLLPNDIIAQPEGKVIVGGEHYTMMPNDFEWNEGNMKIKDLVSSDINELADDFVTLEVEKEERLKFDIDQNPISIIVIKWNEDGSSNMVEIEDRQITMPTKEGYYIYELKAIWDKGKESFIFDVHVK